MHRPAMRVESERSSSRLRDWNAAMKQRRNEHDESERSSSRLRDWNPASAGRGAPAQATSERSSSRLRDWNTSGVAFQMMYGPVRTLIIPTEGLQAKEK